MPGYRICCAAAANPTLRAPAPRHPPRSCRVPSTPALPRMGSGEMATATRRRTCLKASGAVQLEIVRGEETAVWSLKGIPCFGQRRGKLQTLERRRAELRGCFESVVLLPGLPLDSNLEDHQRQRFPELLFCRDSCEERATIRTVTY